MITHMGDTSNLILDHDLDSYYLMDVTLLALPQTQDRLAQATQYGYEVLRRGGPTEAEKVRLAVYAAMLQEADVDRVAGSSRTSMNEDAGFNATSPSLQSRLPVCWRSRTVRRRSQVKDGVGKKNCWVGGDLDRRCVSRAART